MKKPQYGQPPPLTGICTVCSQRVKVRKDGTLWLHQRRKSTCGGALKLPREGSVKNKWPTGAAHRSVRTVSGGAFESDRRRH
jgi:hypothetical protein